MQTCVHQVGMTKVHFKSSNMIQTLTQLNTPCMLVDLLYGSWLLFCIKRFLNLEKTVRPLIVVPNQPYTLKEG